MISIVVVGNLASLRSGRLCVRGRCVGGGHMNDKNRMGKMCLFYRNDRPMNISAKMCRLLRPNRVVPAQGLDIVVTAFEMSVPAREGGHGRLARGGQHQPSSHSNGYILSGFGIIQLEAKHQPV